MVKRENQQLYELSRIDALTGLNNRRAFTDELNRFVRLLPKEKGDKRSNQLKSLCVAFIDLDYFKQINDIHGHDKGDEVLKRTADTIVASTRYSDIICRFGGEEIVVLLPNLCGQEANNLAEKIRHEISSLVFAETADETKFFTVSASIGVVCATSYHEPKEFVVRADKAMYKAKAAGKNQVVLDEM
jgi:diguanylate cyclase (GGDEF)-like protein